MAYRRRRSIQQRRYYVDLDGTFVLADHHPDPERDAIENENELVAWFSTASANATVKCLLIRLYLDEQRPEAICRDTGLTETQFSVSSNRRQGSLRRVGQVPLFPPQRLQKSNALRYPPPFRLNET